MVFKPDRRAGLVSALIILLTITSIQALVLANAFRQRFGPGQYLTAMLFVLTLPALGLWAHWCHQLLTLSYRLDRDALVIRCGWFERTVPLGCVRAFVLGGQLAPGAAFHGISWPGFMRGHLHLRDIGRAQVYSTAPLGRQVILTCDATALGDLGGADVGEDLDGSVLSVAISPRDQAGFLTALQARRELGPLHQATPGLAWRGVGAWPIWRDRPFWVIALGVVALSLGLFGLLAWRYRGLPTRLPLHYSASGLADRIDLKQYLLIVPFIGLMVALLNGGIALLAHRRDRVAAMLVSGGSLGIIALLWVALIGLIF
jgi:hypothetical protein